jgi:hypothetical protein
VSRVDALRQRNFQRQAVTAGLLQVSAFAEKPF